MTLKSSACLAFLVSCNTTRQKKFTYTARASNVALVDVVLAKCAVKCWFALYDWTLAAVVDQA